MANRSLFTILLTLSLLPACKTPSSGTPSEVKGFVVAEQFKWPGNKVDVCWKTPGYDAEKALIKETLVSEYNAKTNFQFTGFFECGTYVAGKLVVEFDPSVIPDAVPGYTEHAVLHMFASPFSESFPSCRLSTERAAICVHNVALHEFGHVAGLVHEQDRSDSTCNQHTGQTSPGAVSVGKFDNDSIMNACNPDYFKETLSLSPGDIVAVNSLYPAPSLANKTPLQKRLDACQVCGQDTKDLRYCGIMDPETGVWQSGQWIQCSADVAAQNFCQPCGQDKENQRYCGIIRDRNWQSGTWILCTGETQRSTVPEAKKLPE